jgi:uncharacterized 2Fe-2S/4Fe-4S cluster protein (DUF4445 family)
MVPEGTDLLAAAQAAGVQLSSVCGGIGSCETCRVRLVSGEVSPLSLEEEVVLTDEDLAAGIRLACQTIPLSDVKVDIPPESLTAVQRLQVEGQETEVAVDPVVRILDLELAPPTLEDLRADDVRLLDALRAAGVEDPAVSWPVGRDLPDRLRALNWRARLALHGGQVVALQPREKAVLGLSVDIGTTSVAAYLVDLESGETLAKKGAMNPQIGFGEDVMSRIAYANQGPDSHAALQQRIIETLNNLTGELCQEAGVEREQVAEAVVVGNTAMHHLFLGLPVRQLGEAPYVSGLSMPVEVRAADLGLQLAPGALVYVPPNVAGYVGADHVAMVLASEIWNSERNVLAMDIGTNTEITLSAGGRLLSCSTASGPVFEGAHIHDGMRAAPGAIERVQIADGQVRLQTIDNQPPVGICGSGILDAVAEMLNAGIVDSSGRMLKTHPMVSTVDGGAALVLVPASQSGHGRKIVVNRRDVHEIQLAKGAIRAGSDLLLKEAGLTVDDLDEIVIAGAFGTYIHIPSAVRVGMFANLPLERFRQIGNAAGVGARQMLISAERRRIAVDLARRIEYIELTVHPEFTDEFMREMYF